jgi:phthiocerol/phenolphthiocerol synthesis type-I polyketide synthase E
VTRPASEHPDAVAIVGMAARLPGARNVGEFWRNLREGVESVERHTREEMIERGLPPVLADDPNYVNASAPLEHADCFDAAFFGYSSREAELMDPQHRIFLECAYHALEDSAFDHRRYQGSVGVYAGCTMNTYLLHNVMPNAAEVLGAVGDLQVMIGNDKDYLSTRVSYKLGLTGPSVTVQTACSSSLVAVHIACRSLADGDCDTALAGGSSVRLPHAAGYMSNPGGTSSPDGHCRAFDAAAGGSIVGNGVGVVVLKRLADARRDGDQIYAVILGTAINNDGAAKASYTAPSVEGQSRAVASALGRAGVSARDISVVEAHGTGTPLGDPIEVAAITSAFRQWTDDTGYCLLGSVKPNIGHLDAAAGVAGLIKTVLALKHRQVAPVINFQRPNPRLELDKTPFTIPTDVVCLSGDRPLLGSVNSLAMGGSNAHAVLSEAPAPEPADTSRRPHHPVLLSARSGAALEQLSQSVGAWAREHRDACLADLAFTLACGRKDWEHRRLLTARDLDDVAGGLAVRGSRRQKDSTVPGPARVAFLFPGQGAQRPGMAEAAAGDPVYTEHLDEALGLFLDKSGIELRSLIAADADEDAAARLAETDVAQPALFAVEWALGRTLLDYGIRPHAMLGHSLGELVAATLAGVFSLPDATALVAERGRLMAATEPGAMLSAHLPEADFLQRYAGHEMTVAAVNAPQLISLSGPGEAIERLAAAFEADGVAHSRLAVTRAFHSPLIAPAAAGLTAALDTAMLSAPEANVVSNVTGSYLTAEQACDPGYWGSQMESQVRFAAGARTLVDEGVTVFLELGPGASLSALASAASESARCLASLAQPQKPSAGLLPLLGDYWLAGGEVDWAAYYAGERRRKLSLPLYPFARTRHWLSPPARGTGTSSVPGAGPARPEPTPTAMASAAPTPAENNGSAGGRTPVERYLAQSWHRMLGAVRVEADSNFFALGGHSLLAMQLVVQLRRDGAPDLDMTILFEYPTLAGLAAYLDQIGFVAPAPGAVPDGAVPHGAGNGDRASILAEIASMSEEEVAAKLAELEGNRKA